MVGAPIAHGGQATVHHAHHVSLGRAAAIKIFHPHVWADDGFRTRFRRECEALVALEHPNVIPVLDAGESDGVGWIVMHLATGGSLDDRLREGMLEFMMRKGTDTKLLDGDSLPLISRQPAL